MYKIYINSVMLNVIPMLGCYFIPFSFEKDDEARPIFPPRSVAVNISGFKVGTRDVPVREQSGDYCPCGAWHLQDLFWVLKPGSEQAFEAVCPPVFWDAVS